MQLISTFAQDDAGNLIRTVTCHLYLRGTTTHATGLQDAAGAPLSNPWTVTGDGKIQFRAPDGEYDLRTVGGGRDYSRAIQCLDVAGQVSAAEDAADRAETAAGDAEQDRILAEAAQNQAAAYANAADSAADRAEAVVVSGDVSFYPAPGKVPVARSTGQIDANWVKGAQRPAQWLENVSGATGAVFPDDSESKMTPQQMLVFDPVFIPAVLDGEITLFSDDTTGVYITNDKKIRLNYYGAFETTQTIAVSDDWVTVTVVSDDNEQDTVSVFFLVNGLPFDVVQVGEFSPMAQRDVLGDAGVRWLFNPGMEYLTNANTNRVTLPGEAVGTVRDIGPNALNGSQATATARPLAGRVPVGGRRNLGFSNVPTAHPINGSGYTFVESVSVNGYPLQKIRATRSGAANSTNGVVVGPRFRLGVPQTLSWVVNDAAPVYSIARTNANLPAATLSFNLGTGNISGSMSGLLDAGIESLGDGLYRLFVVFSISAGGNFSTGDGYNCAPIFSGDPSEFLIGATQSETGTAPTAFQHIRSQQDVVQAGVPDVHYAYFDGNDDVISMTLPSSITGGTIIVAGLNGIYVEDNFSASAGAFDVGPTTYTGGPAGLLAATGSPIGVTVVDGQLTTAELEQERKFYIEQGAPDVPVVI